MYTASGFEEIPHTADWALKVWAPDLPGLFAEAARGMYALAGLRLEDEPRVKRSIQLEAVDSETLLVAFLSELLYIAEQESLGFDSIRVEITQTRLLAAAEGARLASLVKVIKAVTFHNLKISRTAAGFETQIVFDV